MLLRQKALLEALPDHAKTPLPAKPEVPEFTVKLLLSGDVSSEY